MMLKLVAFDYVIAHPDCPYLATETEKLHYFQTTPGLDPSLFPARLYRSKHAVRRPRDISWTSFRSSSLACSVLLPVVTFCYVDGSLAKPSGFGTYLLQYGDLIAQLPLSRVIYVASDQRMFGQAARIFRRLLGVFGVGFSRAREDRTATTSGTLRARQLFEQRNAGSFDKRKLDQLRDELEEFRGRDY
jgi:hypothetical protein